MLKFLDNRRLLSLVLVGALAWSLAGINWGGPLGHTGGAGTLRDFVLALLPPELSPGFCAWRYGPPGKRLPTPWRP